MWLPAVNRARVKAHRVACLSNERQILLGFRARLDNETGTSLAKQRLVEWMAYDVALPQNVWICPAAPPVKSRPSPAFREGIYGSVYSAWQMDRWDRDNIQYYAGWQGRTNYPVVRTGSYGFNVFMQSGQLQRPPFTSKENFTDESQVIFPSLTPVIGDCISFFGWMRADCYPPISLI